MKKTEAISILATSVRPREAKDRERYDEAVGMAIEALKCSETPKSSERTSETAQADHNADIGKKVSISDNHENDCISRQAALDAIMGQPPEPHYPSWYAAQIEKLPAAQPEQRWIPCSERLPEERGFYLTTTKDKAVYCDHWNEDNFDRTEMVIAWMPLPEAYQGGDE